MIRSIWMLLNGITIVLCVVLVLLYLNQIVYPIIGLFSKKRYLEAARNHRYAVLVCARNEANIIANLIESIRKQNYPAQLLDIYVMADNCTDNTAEAARRAGAIVYERFNKVKVGKSYALDTLIQNIQTEHADAGYEGYIFFDADNLMHRDFVREMNKMFDAGEEIITGYRNTKNFGDSWLSSGHALMFLRECKSVGTVREKLGLSTYVTGTGFLASAKIFEEEGGWNYNFMTEDLQFSLEQTLKGRRVAYCEKAVFFDEQPVKFKDSWNQRMRWVKGLYQNGFCYTKRLMREAVRQKRFTCWDLMTMVIPAPFIAIGWIGFYTVTSLVLGIISAAKTPIILYTTLSFLALVLVVALLVILTMGLATTISNWRTIRASFWQKLRGAFAYPMYLLVFVAILVIAPFKNVEWKEIKHEKVMDLEELNKPVK